MNDEMAKLRAENARLKDDAGALPYMIADNRRLRAESVRLREALEGIAEEFERTVRHIDSKGKGGQHVPFHGDFASACQLPSFCSSARWWATHLRAALSDTSDEWLRALKGALETFMVWHGHREGERTNHDYKKAVEIVEEVLRGK